MISYMMVGTNDLARAVKFFDTLKSEMDASKVTTRKRPLAGVGELAP